MKPVFWANPYFMRLFDKMSFSEWLDIANRFDLAFEFVVKKWKLAPTVAGMLVSIVFDHSETTNRPIHEAGITTRQQQIPAQGPK